MRGVEGGLIRLIVLRYNTNSGGGIDFLFTHSFFRKWTLSAAFRTNSYDSGEMMHHEIVKDLPCSAAADLQSTEFMAQ